MPFTWTRPCPSWMPSISPLCVRSGPCTEPLSPGPLLRPFKGFRALHVEARILHMAASSPPGPAHQGLLSFRPSSSLQRQAPHAFPPCCSLRKNTLPSSSGCPSPPPSGLEPLVLPFFLLCYHCFVAAAASVCPSAPREGTFCEDRDCVSPGPGAHVAWCREADIHPV